MRSTSLILMVIYLQKYIFHVLTSAVCIIYDAQYMALLKLYESYACCCPTKVFHIENIL
jgi:hypothetical protein